MKFIYQSLKKVLFNVNYSTFFLVLLTIIPRSFYLYSIYTFNYYHSVAIFYSDFEKIILYDKYNT